MRAGTWFDPKSENTLLHSDVIARAANAPVVLLGEQHDRADHHRWQMHVTAGLLSHRSDIVMGFEMFPARLNPVLAEWVAGDLDEPGFLKSAEWGQVWGFDPELYMPIFRFCRDLSIPMIGLNCRRALVSEVGRDGWEPIPDADREGLTPAAPASSAYRRYLYDVTGGNRPDREAQSPDDPAFERFVRAQQTWDRAFACRIAEATKLLGAPLVVGIIGRGHLEYGGGVQFQLENMSISDSVTLLPHDVSRQFEPGIADALCAMPTKTDTPESE